MNHFQLAIAPDVTALATRRGWCVPRLLVVTLAYLATRGHQADFLAHTQACGEDTAADPAGPASCTDPSLILSDLVDQLQGLGVEDWNGAEGLSLDAARGYLASPAAARAIAQALVGADAGTAETGSYWDEQPDFPLADWQYEVQNNDTRHGYAEWVLSARAQASELGHADSSPPA